MGELTTFDDITLSAYVDGELDAETAAAVAKAAASDSGLAARVAELAELKALMPGAIPPMPVIDIPEIPVSVSPTTTTTPGRPRSEPPSSGGPARRVLFMRVAAAFLALAVLGGVGYGLSERSGGAEPATPFAAIRAHHERWAEAARRSDPAKLIAAAERAASGPAGGPQGAGDLIIPDLGPGGLTLVAAEQVDAGGRSAARFGFLGSRGCRVSFFVIDGNSPVSVPDGTGAGGLRISVWAAQDRAFALLASGMEVERFKTLAAVLKAHSETGRPFDPPTRDVLVRSRAASAPCLA